MSEKNPKYISSDTGRDAFSKHCRYCIQHLACRVIVMAGDALSSPCTSRYWNPRYCSECWCMEDAFSNTPKGYKMPEWLV